MKFLLLLLAVLPGILICVFIYRMDKYEKEPPMHLFLCFCTGMLIPLPVIQLEEWTQHTGLDDPEHLGLAILSSYLIIALSEELVKFLATLFYPFQKAFFNEPFDGIIYAVTIAMGFATLENILYAHRYGIETVILRAFTAVPAHAAFAVIMGYYIGKAKFHPDRRNGLLLAGLLVPVLIHGTYNLFILQKSYDWLVALAVVTLAITIHFALRLIRIQQENSPFKELPKNKSDMLNSNES